MMEMKTIFKYGLILIAAASVVVLSGCSKEELPEIQQKPESGKLTIYASDFVADWTGPETKSIVSLDDKIQKQIHNLYYFFYDATGYIEKIYYQDVLPTISLEVEYEDFRDEDGDIVSPEGVVFILANTRKMSDVSTTNHKPILVLSDKTNNDDVAAWKQAVATVGDFAKRGLFPLFIEHSSEGVQGGNWKLGRPDHIIMMGYFDGTLGFGNFHIPLGRLVSRLRVNLSGPGLGEQARITIKNAPLYTAAFPESGTFIPNDPSAANFSTYWGDFVETLDNGKSSDNVNDAVGNDGYYGGITGTAGKYSASAFYFCGENDYDYTGIKTVLKVDTWDTKVKPNADGTRTDAPDRTYELELGQDSPNISSSMRDYGLYRNISYTFNIELNKP